MNFFEDAKQRDDHFAAAWGKLRDAHNEGQSQDTIAAAAKAFAPLVGARIAALHEVLRGLGLSAVEPCEKTIHVVGITEKVVQLAFEDLGTKQEIKLDIAWNGNAFLAGRRYEASLSRVSLSDAEITRTSILRVDIDRTHAALVITFLTLDGRDARIHVDAARPLDPKVEGKVPKASIETLLSRPPTASLAALSSLAMEAAERAGAGKGFLARLMNGSARQAHADLTTMSSYLAQKPDTKAEIEGWKQAPDSQRILAEAILRRLSGDSQIEAPVLIRALTIIAISRVLALAE